MIVHSLVQGLIEAKKIDNCIPCLGASNLGVELILILKKDGDENNNNK